MAEDSPEPGVYEVTSVEPDAEKARTESASDSEDQGAGRAILSALGLAAMILVIGLLGLVRLLGWGGVAIAAGVLVGTAVLAKTTLGKAKNGRRTRATPGRGRSGWKPGGAGGGGRWGKGKGGASPAARSSRLPGLGLAKGKGGLGTKAAKGGSATRSGPAAMQKGRLGRALPFGRGKAGGRAMQGGSGRGRLGGGSWGPASLRRKGKAGGGSSGGSSGGSASKRGKAGKARGGARRRRRWLSLGLPLAWAAWRGRGKSEAEEGSEPRQGANQRIAALLQEGYERAELKTRGLGGKIRGWVWKAKEAEPEVAPQAEAGTVAAATQGDPPTPGGPSSTNTGRSIRMELPNPEVPDGMLDYRSFLVDEAAGVEEAAARAVRLADIADTELPVADAFRDVVGEYAAAWGLVAEMGAELVAEFGVSHETEIGRLENPRTNEQLWDTNNNDA